MRKEATIAEARTEILTAKQVAVDQQQAAAKLEAEVARLKVKVRATAPLYTPRTRVCGYVHVDVRPRGLTRL